MKPITFLLASMLALTANVDAQQSNRGFYRGGLTSGFILFFVNANGALAVYTNDHGQTSSGGGSVSGTGFFSFNTVDPSQMTVTPVSGTLAPDSVSGKFTPSGFPEETFTATKVPIFGPTENIAGRYYGIGFPKPAGNYIPFTILIDSQSRVVVNGIGTDSISSVNQVTGPQPENFGADIAQEFNSQQATFAAAGPSTHIFVSHGVMEGTFAANGVTYQFRASKESSANHLANISTRGPVNNTSKGQLISGFIITGGPKLVLIRALGPTLQSSGFCGGTDFPCPEPYLNNPMVQLFKASSQNPIAVNDDWQTNANVTDISATTIPPNFPKEAALLVRLEPGQYTAVVSSADSGGSGVAIVEVYEIDRD
jgi:hypothetical protein